MRLRYLLPMNQGLRLWILLPTKKCDNVSMYLSMMTQDLDLCDLLPGEKCDNVYVYVKDGPSSQVRLCAVVHVYVRVCGEETKSEATRPTVESGNVTTLHVPEFRKPHTVCPEMFRTTAEKYEQ